MNARRGSERTPAFPRPRPGRRWVWELRQNVQNPNLIIALVGNKVDLAEQRQVRGAGEGRQLRGRAGDRACSRGRAGPGSHAAHARGGEVRLSAGSIRGADRALCTRR